MFCPNCGTQIPDSAAFCSGCGTPVQNKDGSGAVSSQAEEQDQILMEGICNRVKSAMNVQNGKAALTKSRFIYYKHKAGAVLTAGLFVNLMQGSFDFDIPLTDIKEIVDGKQGLQKTIVFHCKDGNEYNFYFAKRDEWKAKLEEAIRAANTVKA